MKDRSTEIYAFVPAGLTDSEINQRYESLDEISTSLLKMENGVDTANKYAPVVGAVVLSTVLAIANVENAQAKDLPQSIAYVQMSDMTAGGYGMLGGLIKETVENKSLRKIKDIGLNVVAGGLTAVAVNHYANDQFNAIDAGTLLLSLKTFIDTTDFKAWKSVPSEVVSVIKK